MRKIFVFIVIMLFNYNMSAQEKCQKPEKFPKETVELLKEKFIPEMTLDVDTLLTADFTVYHKKSQEKELSFYGMEHSELIGKYLDYLYVRGILAELSVVEKESDQEKKRNYLFKLEIELNNRPVAIDDLKFVYKNWDIK